MTNDKYKMFRNYMINELGITKEDIREWITESIENEVRRVVDNEYKRVNIADLIERKIYIQRDYWNDKNELSKDIKSEIARQLIDKANTRLDLVLIK